MADGTAACGKVLQLRTVGGPTARAVFGDGQGLEHDAVDRAPRHVRFAAVAASLQSDQVADGARSTWTVGNSGCGEEGPISSAVGRHASATTDPTPSTVSSTGGSQLLLGHRRRRVSSRRPVTHGLAGHESLGRQLTTRGAPCKAAAHPMRRVAAGVAAAGGARESEVTYLEGLIRSRPGNRSAHAGRSSGLTVPPRIGSLPVGILDSRAW